MADSQQLCWLIFMRKAHFCCDHGPSLSGSSPVSLLSENLVRCFQKALTDHLQQVPGSLDDYIKASLLLNSCSGVFVLLLLRPPVESVALFYLQLFINYLPTVPPPFMPE